MRFFQAASRLLGEILERQETNGRSHLDVACGTGLAVPFFEGRGFRSIGVDLSLPMLRMARLRTGFQGLGAFGLPELFLRTLDAEILKRWIADNLTAGNAAIWVAGELAALGAGN